MNHPSQITELFRFGFNRFPEIIDGFIQDLVFPVSDAGDGGRHVDMRLDSHALKLPSVGVPDAVAGESGYDPARKRDPRQIAIGAMGRASDESRIAAGFQDKAGVFGLADRIFIDQNDNLPFILPLF